jgi:hypothetical protein
VRATPAAAVLDPEGRVLYGGRIDDRLEEALAAVLAGEMPAVTATEAPGTPLPMPRLPSPGEEITFARHIAPILWRNCAGCHRPGEVAPFALLSYRDAAKRAEFLREVTTARTMPPWRAVPGFGIFRDALHLTDRELALISAWADAGAPEGDPADLPPPPRFPDGWQLGAPDLVYTMPGEVAIPASGEELYRSFAIPLPADREHLVSAFEFRPGNRRVVHHAKLFVDESGESRRRDEAELGPGFASVGSADLGRSAIWEWTPGTSPHTLPEGVARVLKPGSDLVLFVHYHPTGKPEVDRSSFGIMLSRTPPTRLVAGIPMGTSQIDIPPGASRHRVTVTAVLPADAHAHVVMPHAHYLLREMTLRATRPDGIVQYLLRIEDWDLNWQGQFSFARPVALSEGTRLDLVAYYDNSADNPRNPSSPPRRVVFGPASTDEMLGCHVLVTPDRPEDYPTFRARWPTGL